MSDLRKALLVQRLQKTLFPALVAEGFTGPEFRKVAIDDLGIEPPPEASLYHFRQKIAGVGRLVVTVDIKSFSRPTFQILAGHVPEEGTKIWCPEEIIPPERVDATMLEVQAFLQAVPQKSYSPFRQAFLPSLMGSQRGIAKSVDHALELLPDLLNWLKAGTPSKNIWVVQFPRPKKGA